MTTPTCPRTSLVEALHDGRLGAQERASMERHVAACKACAGLSRDLSRIGDAVRAPREQATPLEHQRARLALLRRAAELAPARVSVRPLRLLLAAALLTLAVALGWIGGYGYSSAGSTQSPIAQNTGQNTRQNTSAPSGLESPEALSLRPSEGARFAHTHQEGLDVVTLEKGTLDVTLRPLAAGERFVVRMKDAEIEVRGTAFRVETEEGRIRSVTAIEGTVEVQYAGSLAVIPAGGSWRATADTPEPAPSAAPLVPSAKPDAAPLVPSARARTKVAVRAAVVRQARTVHEPEQAAPRAVPALERQIEAPENSAPPAPPAPPAMSPASRAFADAMGALRRGDYAGSAADLDRFAATYPGDARTDEAEYLRAIALQRAGRAGEAAAAARRYLMRWPKGAHRAEAKRIAGEGNASSARPEGGGRRSTPR